MDKTKSIIQLWSLALNLISSSGVLTGSIATPEPYISVWEGLHTFQYIARFHVTNCQGTGQASTVESLQSLALYKLGKLKPMNVFIEYSQTLHDEDLLRGHTRWLLAVWLLSFVAIHNLLELWVPRNVFVSAFGSASGMRFATALAWGACLYRVSPMPILIFDATCSRCHLEKRGLTL